MNDAVNLAKAYETVTAYWSPKVLGQVNDQYLKVAKLKGELAWHKHDDEDELFMVMKGQLTIKIEDRDPVQLAEGEFFVVPKGVMHNPVAREECWIVLIETVSTKHTGDIVIEGTKSIEVQLA